MYDPSDFFLCVRYRCDTFRVEIDFDDVIFDQHGNFNRIPRLKLSRSTRFDPKKLTGLAIIHFFSLYANVENYELVSNRCRNPWDPLER
jgi:hypothetical protein